MELLETLELANRERRADISPHLRRMHLVVTALREFIQTVSAYNEIKSLSYSDKKHIAKMCDLLGFFTPILARVFELCSSLTVFAN